MKYRDFADLKSLTEFVKLMRSGHAELINMETIGPNRFRVWFWEAKP